MHDIWIICDNTWMMYDWYMNDMLTDMRLLCDWYMTLPDNCHFWYATICFRPVKGTPKKCVNSQQKLSRVKTASVNQYFGMQIHIFIYFNYAWRTWCFIWRTGCFVWHTWCFVWRTWCFGWRNWCLWHWDVDLLHLDFGMVQLIFSKNVQICVLFSK